MVLPPPNLIIENGTGVTGANAYANDAFVTQYLADQGRGEGAAWDSLTVDQRSAAIIQATSHIENRFRQVFKGSKRYQDISVARATISFTSQPLDTETVTVGTQVYRASTVLAAAGDFLIASTIPKTIGNLSDAINLNASTSGSSYHADTVANADAGAQIHGDLSLLAFGKLGGAADNATPTTTTVTGAAWNFATLTGGSSQSYAQPLSFPRAGLFDRDGFYILGIPLRLQQAVAEYSERAAASILAPDPSIDALGGSVIRLREKVGPIDTDTEYMPGSTTSGSLPAYPAADRLLSDYISSKGSVIRG